VTVNGARTPSRLLFFAPMTRTLVAVVVTTLLGGACARAPRPVAPGARGSIPMHTLVPRPVTFEPGAGDGFQITATTTIHVTAGNDAMLRVGRFLADWIGIAAGPVPPRVDAGGSAPSRDAIVLQLGRIAGTGDEAYELTVGADRVVITGSTPAGVFYGVQTFRQLLPAFVEHEATRADASRPVRAGAVRIADHPRFAWRGAMLDVARHFFSVADVKRYMDVMALHKLNRLHLHLADDQGWRIEIKSWPNLAIEGGRSEVGGGTGGYYTQQDYAELIDYGRDRQITIVPEIDMPGHTNAALASYPELNCDGVPRQRYSGIEVGFSSLCVEKEITYKFIDDVVREISALTPGPYFHVGGDEVKTLTAPQYIAFIERVQKIVQSHGKEMIGWDEIAPAELLPTTIVQHWRPDGAPSQAVAKGARVVMSVANRTYLDMQYDPSSPIGLHWAAYIDVPDAYNWDPATVVKEIPASAILGVEAPLWSETAANMRDVEWLAFPRLAAIAEIAWSSGERQWAEFAGRLGAQAPRWTALGINFHRSANVPWTR
jgi:hexosaminidase